MGVLEQRVAIVTGAARGQGLAEAQRFVTEGASVVLVDRLDDELQEATAALGPSARCVVGDVGSADVWSDVVQTTTSAFGGVDILVNNAGVHVNRSFDDTDEQTFRAVLDTNLVGAFLGTKAVTPSMRARGGGAIVNTSSAAAFKAIPMSSAYVASKFGLRGLTRATALELGPDRIRVNAICPGVVRTPMSATLLRYHEEEITPKIPLRAVAEPADIADLVLFLVSDAAAYITGGEYLIDGGSMA
jgi:3alpha(or 20beta)-hydroxysteroid dehydrogenase